MGMDVYGKRATTEEGKYFRNSVWGWRPLANYIVEVAPAALTSKCAHWHSNDGCGLDAHDAKELAEFLQAEIDSGRTARYALLYKHNQEMAPDEPCDLCDGTGTRMPIPQRGAGNPKTDGIKCNGCDATGHVRPWTTHYPFDVENVQEFATFLKGCGGFEIN